MNLKTGVLFIVLSTLSTVCGATELTASNTIRLSKVLRALPAEVVTDVARISTDASTPDLFRMDVTEFKITSKITPSNSSPAVIKKGERFKLTDLFIIEKSERPVAKYTITCRNENSISADVLRGIISRNEFPTKAGAFWIALTEITTETTESVEQFLARVLNKKTPSIVLTKESPATTENLHYLRSADDCAISKVQKL